MDDGFWIERSERIEGTVVAEDESWPHRSGLPFIGHKSNNAMPYDTRADTEVRQNDTNAWNPVPFLPKLTPSTACIPLSAVRSERWKFRVVFDSAFGFEKLRNRWLS